MGSLGASRLSCCPHRQLHPVIGNWRRAVVSPHAHLNHTDTCTVADRGEAEQLPRPAEPPGGRAAL